jgi:hypothetical protein
MNRIEFDDGTIVLGNGKVIEPDAECAGGRPVTAAGHRPAQALSAATGAPAPHPDHSVPRRRGGGC